MFYQWYEQAQSNGASPRNTPLSSWPQVFLYPCRFVFVLTLSFSLHNRRERWWTAPARRGAGPCSESWGQSISAWIRKTVHPWPEGAWGEWWNCEICERRPSSDTLVLYWASKDFKDSNLKAKKIAMCVWRKPSSVIINLSFHALVPCPDPKPPDIIITRYIQHLVAKTKENEDIYSYIWSMAY